MVAEVEKTDPQAVIFIGSANTVSEGVKAMRKAGSKAQVVTLSNNASGGFIKSLGATGPNTIVSQVFPFERSLGDTDRERSDQAGEHNRAYRDHSGGPGGIRGSKGAGRRTAASGAQSEPREPSQCAQRVAPPDIGGMVLNYSPNNHTGLNFADLSIIGSEGKFVR